MQEGNSVLYAIIKRLAKGAWLPDDTRDVFLHPTAYAGWVGFLITMINLLPIGQLDGGHIATAYFGNRYGRFARRLHQALPLVATLVFSWVVVVVRHEVHGTHRATMGDVIGIAVQAAMPWLVWWLMVALVKRFSGSADHPPVELRPLVRSRRRLFWLMVVVFGLLLMPVPMRTTLAGVEPPPPPPDTLAAPRE
jgi:membrane-associated protease RseP (regulator of RpoE activity)